MLKSYYIKGFFQVILMTLLFACSGNNNHTTLESESTGENTPNTLPSYFGSAGSSAKQINPGQPVMIPVNVDRQNQSFALTNSETRNWVVTVAGCSLQSPQFVSSSDNYVTLTQGDTGCTAKLDILIINSSIRCTPPDNTGKLGPRLNKFFAILRQTAR